MKRIPDRTDFDRIAALCDRRWDRHYVRAKLRSDPVYTAVAETMGDCELPVLDIGCGLGLLAHYLRACGRQMPVTGFDYDERKIVSAQVLAQRSGHAGLAFFSGDARQGLPDFSGHVVILDILQFFSEEEQNVLLNEAARRVAPGGKLVIRSGLADDSWRFRITVLGDYLAKVTLWMKAAPLRYPTAEQFQRVLTEAGLKTEVKPLWGGTPFNNHLIVGERA